MLKGRLIDASTIIIDNVGLPVIETEPPTAMDGYISRPSWVDGDGAITQVWTVVPLAGTVTDAVERLARMQAADLPDDKAVEVPLLFPAWSGDGVTYSVGDRVVFEGTLYKVLLDHRSQMDWAPDISPSLFSPILPGQDGSVGPWVQPDSTNGYSKGDKVTHGGKLWESTADNNVWEPGSVGAPWVEVAE